MAEEAAPLGPLEAAAPPLGLPLVEAAPPEPPPVDDAAPPLVAPVALLESVLEPDEGVATVEEEDDEPPGITTVSFSLVVVLDAADPLGALPPGTTVVVSFRSQPESARAPTSTNT